MIVRILLFCILCTLGVKAYSPLSIYEANGDLLIKDPIGLTFNGFTLSQTNGEASIVNTAAGTVTSVALNNGDAFTSITGSPITSSGTITIDFDEASFLQNGNNLSELSNTSTARTNLGVAIGSDVQAYDVDLDNWAVNNGSEIQALTTAGFTIKTSTGANNLLLGSGGSANATAYGGWNFNGATANTIASFGASKTLSSLSTSTYPSLTELSYVKGVTSAIQTQLNAKQASSSNLDVLALNNGANLTNIDSTDITRGANIVVFEATTDTATGDGKAYLVIPSFLNGMNLVRVHARVNTAGTTGTTDIQIHNVTDAVDMLSTKLTIDSGETGSDTAATPAVINTSNDDVATNDLLRVDLDAVSTTAAQGLIITLEFQLP